jgi:Tol biopolymer transport system component
MRWRLLALGLIASSVVACAAILGIDDGIPRDGGSDAALDVQADARVEAASCDLSAPFKAPVALSSLNTPAFEAQPRLLPDERTVFFERVVVDAGTDLFTAVRAVASASFGAPTPLTELDTPNNEGDPTVSPDGLRIFFASDRPGGLGANDIWQAVRDAASSPFGIIALTPNVSSTQDELQTYYVPGALYFASNRSTTYHIYRAAELSGGFASPLLIPELASQTFDGCPVITTDELRIYFTSLRSDAGSYQIWTSVRVTSSQPWPTPTLVSELASFGNAVPSWISPDGCRLYLSSDQSGNEDMYVASK